MALSAEAQQLLTELETATNEYANKELERLNRRAALLRRMNTRIDDFVGQTIAEVTTLAVTDIDSMLE
jgi:hypothetical protein